VDYPETSKRARLDPQWLEARADPSHSDASAAAKANHFRRRSQGEGNETTSRLSIRTAGRRSAGWRCLRRGRKAGIALGEPAQLTCWPEDPGCAGGFEGVRRRVCQRLRRIDFA